MGKMWEGRFKKELNSEVNDFNSSISIDYKMYESDILGSIAHATMLGKQNIISIDEANLIVKTLTEILEEIKCEKLNIDLNAEDIHMFIEEQLTKRIGNIGKKLHTARSRNDQVALDIRMHLKNETNLTITLLKEFLKVIIDLAMKHKKTIMPGYTHLQRAQPITFTNHMLAYAFMIKRDIERFKDAYKRLDISPLGCCALAGTTYNIDRKFVSLKLGFSDICLNSLDGVSDRDFVIELASAIAISMMHLSRLSEEIILWCSWEFKFVELDDAYSTGSSIMPQKKNPDVCELIRGKTGRCYGNLVNLLTMLKGLPLAYNKDMQEDKNAIFDSFSTIKDCVKIFIPLLKTMKINEENMKNAAAKGFINATDLADYLVKKGLPFREAYKISGTIVAYAIDNNFVLENIPLNEYKKYSDLIENDIYEVINLEECTFKRTSIGASGLESVDLQIEVLKEFLK